MLRLTNRLARGRKLVDNEGRSKRHSKLSTKVRVAAVLHAIFYLVIALLVYLFVVHWNLTVVAVALVIISKWRFIAVRPRFWWANLRANLPDFIVGLSTVIWLAHIGDTWLGVTVALLYAGWLLILKPRTSNLSMQFQAGWSTFIGINAIVVVWGADMELLALALSWVVLWANARHFLGIFDDQSTPALSVVWATIMSQFVWLCLQWLEIFSLPGGIELSQVALIITTLGYGMGGWYSATHRNDDEQISIPELLLRYGLFTAVAMLIVLAWTPWHGGV